MNNMQSEKRALIFGAGGFVGRYLIEELKSSGYRVWASDLRAGTQMRGIEAFYECDLLDARAVKQMIEELSPTHIINLAAVSSVALSWKIPQKTVEVNVCGTLNILEAVKDMPVQAEILLIGSSEEYAVSSQPLSEESLLSAGNPYGISKAMQESFSELYRKRFGMRIYHARAFNHTGVGQSDSFVVPGWCRQAAEISLSGKPGVMRVGNMQVRRDFSHVSDVVRAYRLILEKGDPQTVYNVGSGNAVLLSDLLEYIVALSEQPIEVQKDPALFRPADNPVICCDNGKICRELEWMPKYSIFDAAKELFDYYKEAAGRR